MGVDQVLQVEMVLPNGSHVRFGPTEWEDASGDGFTVPRTKVVSGVCRSNPDEQVEEKWIWEDCPEEFDIDFGDLWFAVRGGGGGTWGVVTSVSLQLHDILPYNAYLFNLECYYSAIGPLFEEFKAKYIMAPSLLNVTKETSLACGSPDFLVFLFCYGEEDVIHSWTKFLESNDSTGPAEVACLRKISPENLPGIVESPKSYAEMVLDPFFSNPRFLGKIGDMAPLPLPPLFARVLVPQSWLDESEENINIILKNAVAAPYYSFGGATVTGHDQANAVTQAHRDAAAMVSFFEWEATDEENFWGNLFPKMFDISDKTKLFPPVFGSNHAGRLHTGPLKEDWTKPCPREWTFEERSEKCISFQEAIYGTELLSRLEAIKKAVDPQFMFDCENCIGNKLTKASHSQSQDDEPSPETETATLSGKPSDQPSGASYAYASSTFAAAISAAALYLFFRYP
jgi:hypothetical protein